MFDATLVYPGDGKEYSFEEIRVKKLAELANKPTIQNPDSYDPFPASLSTTVHARPLQEGKFTNTFVVARTYQHSTPCLEVQHPQQEQTVEYTAPKDKPSQNAQPKRKPFGEAIPSNPTPAPPAQQQSVPSAQPSVFTDDTVRGDFLSVSCTSALRFNHWIYLGLYCHPDDSALKTGTGCSVGYF